jgi:hypothetical protein
MRVNRRNMTSAGVEVVLLEDEAKNQALSRGQAPKIGYGKEPDGSFADLVARQLWKRRRPPEAARHAPATDTAARCGAPGRAASAHHYFSTSSQIEWR